MNSHKHCEQFPSRALDEHQSKQFLKTYGIPVVSEIAAGTTAETLAAARRIGFPVVVKGLGTTLLHKTERGLVQLNLVDEESVEEAVDAIRANSGDELEGFVVQPHMRGRRELVAGLVRDPKFGAAVMLGLGGTFAEALADVTFRITPLSEGDAREMMSELRARKLLSGFRGEAAADERQLIDTLMGLSRIGAEHPEIEEIDINPLLIGADGQVCAVDALVVIGRQIVEKPQKTAVDPLQLKEFFHPGSIAFVGASAKFGKWGYRLVINTICGGYQGDIYLVNPKGGTIFGRKAYTSVEEIPAPVDLGVVTIPAARVPDLIPQFSRKGIRYMLLIASGFSEVGEEGRRLEERIVQDAQKAGILILGPNTMGISNPHIGLYCNSSQAKPGPGDTAIVSQSGNVGVQLMGFAEQQNIGIRVFAGIGNEAMIATEDCLAALEQDPHTRTVVAYVEDVKDGRLFLEASQRLSKKKPIVLLKGGRSATGNRAAASHTGALSTDTRIFDALCRQAGIVQVTRPGDLLDLAAAFSSLPLPKGNRVALMTLGGGWGVIAADLCAEHGIEVPELTDEIMKRIDGLLPGYWSHGNPVDLVGEADGRLQLAILEILLCWDACDAVINLGIMGRRHILPRMAEASRVVDPDLDPDFFPSLFRETEEFERTYVERIVQLMEAHEKPVYGVSFMDDKQDRILYEVDDARYKGVFFKTPERAVKAMSRMHEYQRFRCR